MPDVGGMELDVALTLIEDAGFSGKVDVEGGGMFGVVDESNWLVCEQTPPAGEPLAEVASVVVDRECTSDEGESPASPTADAADDEALSPSPSTPASTEAEAPIAPLTIENSPELAVVLALTDYCSPDIAAFAAAHAGEQIEFDGSIGAMNPHGESASRFDILIGAGDYSETTSIGPAFQFRDVNTTSDLNYADAGRPDSIGVGDNLRVVAEIDRYEEPSCLLLLDPVSTGFRTP